MLTSIDVKFIFYSACLGDKGLFASANILQIAKKKTYVCILWIFIECKLLTGPAIVRIFLGLYASAWSLPENPCREFD